MSARAVDRSVFAFNNSLQGHRECQKSVIDKKVMCPLENYVCVVCYPTNEELRTVDVAVTNRQRHKATQTRTLTTEHERIITKKGMSVTYP